jgi:hypothetical protein
MYALHDMNALIVYIISLTSICHHPTLMRLYPLSPALPPPQIDSRMRWRQAEGVLADDPRLTAVADEYHREELFNDFVTELGKTEREDRRRARKEALEHVAEVGVCTACHV